MALTWATRSALGAAALVLLAGCGSGSSSTQSENTASAGSGASSAPATGTSVVVDLTEFKVTPAKTTLAPGDYTLVATEKGQVPHALSISGPGLKVQSTKVLDPGDQPAGLSVTLKSGTYTLWCPVGNHRAQGMQTTLTVS